MGASIPVPAAILNGKRSYILGKLLGEGAHGICYKATVEGDKRFEGFERDVKRAVVKIGKPMDIQEGQAHPLLIERAAYEFPHPGIVKMLDSGVTEITHDGERVPVPYIVLEELYKHPFHLFNGKVVDPATAIDTFYNLLDHLESIHRGDSATGREGLVLMDVKPDNCMLRMSNSNGEYSVEDIVRRIAAGAYEPVWIDLGCVRHRAELRNIHGELGEIIGSPLYLPPETFRFKDGKITPGTYSEQTDVYALTLTFYNLLTGKRPYEHRGIDGTELLETIQAVTDKKMSPYDLAAIDKLPITNEAREAVKSVVSAGCAPISIDRLTPRDLLRMSKEAFAVTARLRDDVTGYRYDATKGLPWHQTLVPRIDAEHYLANNKPQ